MRPYNSQNQEVPGGSMRLILRIGSDPNTRIPLHYNELIQGFIYRYLDQHLAQELHERGIQEGKRHLKLFTFSRLLGPSRIQQGWLEPRGTLSLVIASPMISFLESFVHHLVTHTTIRLGDALLTLESVEVELPHPYSNSVLLKALSPIVVYSTLTHREGKKKTYYYAPQEPEFERLVLGNLRRKIRAFTGQDIPEDGASFRPVRVTTQNQHIVLYKGTVIKGWTGIYELSAPEPYFRMALDAGLGAKNSQGFGCVAVWKGKQ